MILGAVLQVVIDKLASPEEVNFFRRTKLDQSLVNMLTTLMTAAEKLLLDAEEKQMTGRAVKCWLEELKHWFYELRRLLTRLLLGLDVPPLKGNCLQHLNQ